MKKTGMLIGAMFVALAGVAATPTVAAESCQTPILDENGMPNSAWVLACGTKAVDADHECREVQGLSPTTAAYRECFEAYYFGTNLPPE